MDEGYESFLCRYCVCVVYLLVCEGFCSFFFFFPWQCKSITLDAVGQFGKAPWSLLSNSTVIRLLYSLFSPIP